MTTPNPLTPADCDLQDFPFMPLHVARLRDSDLAAEAHPEACWYAVLLWSASWHQIPAASLPNNESVLARLCGLGRDVKTFRRHRADALRGWIECSDGRLYHPVVAEQAMAALKSKVEQRFRAECARIKKQNQRQGTELPCPAFDAFLSLNFPNYVAHLSPGTPEHVPRDEGSKRQGQGDPITVTDVTGADAPPDPSKIMFDAGIRLLGAAGKSEPAARKIIGRWKNSHTEAEVIEALGAAQRQNAIDPVAFIEGRWRSDRKRDTEGFSIGGTRMSSPC